MRGLRFFLCLPFFLAACGAEPTWAPETQVTRALHVTGEPSSLTLYTVIRKSSGEGAHAALVVDNAHRALFDPAGTWFHRTAPERNDVHFGMTDLMMEFYIDYHARETYYVVEQKIYVSPEVAERAMQEIQAYGAVPKAMCGNSVSRVLRRLSGFEDMPQTYFPAKIMRAMREKPGVIERTIYDDDSDDNKGLLATQPAEL